MSLSIDDNNPVSAFYFLEKGLNIFPLPTKTNNYRKASPNEFMFMGKRDDNFTFKHIVTRNYLFVKVEYGKPKIIIPVGGPFHGGEFDND